MAERGSTAESGEHGGAGSVIEHGRSAEQPSMTGRPTAPERVWDLVVIGGGTAGLVAARTAAGFGSRVLMIEEDRLGGDCLWTGCVPSKAYIAAAAAAAAAHTSSHLGVTAREVVVDFPAVMAHVRRAMEIIAPDDSAESLEEAGVEVLQGRAVFSGERTLEVDGRTIRFHQAFIGTGGSPAPLDVPGADRVPVLTSSTFWDLDEQPERLLVLGGGAIGCEIAQATARLGSSVTVVHRGARLLAKEGEKASAVIAAALARDGVDLRMGRQVVSLEPGLATLDDGVTVPFDRMLQATGRRPNTAGLGTDAAGVDLDERGNVIVDNRLRTSNPRIWASGDVVGRQLYTHTAGVDGSIAAGNAVLGLSRTVDTSAVPRVTFAHPEVAAVGVAPEEAGRRGMHVTTVEHHDLDRAVCEGETDGFTQLVVDRRGRIRGGVIVGPRAGESLGGVGVAIRNGLTVSDIAKATHAYPTFTDAVWKAAVAEVRAGLKTGVTGRAVGVLHRVRRRRVS